MHRKRNAKIIATLGPASSTPDIIEELFAAGVDVFRINMSHGDHGAHRNRIEIIRRLEQHFGRPIAILMDLQGPKLRVGQFASGRVELIEGQHLRLDLDTAKGTTERVCLPHKEIFAAINPSTDLLLDDGKVRLEVIDCGADFAETIVRVPGPVSDNKGVNVPGVVLPLSPLTAKDRKDLAFGLELGVDWVAASFIQRREDLVELRELVGDRALILSKLEKPAALDRLYEIVELSDAVMVARGDLGVELPPERVPPAQKRIISACREAGKPVVVATQMLESMINSPVPTRAEASDVALAIYDGADAVMLSAESAAGHYPTEAVTIMDRIIREVERDPQYREGIDARTPVPQTTAADAISDALRRITQTLSIAATVTYTSSGFSGMRTARERPASPILAVTPHLHTARRLSLVWGIHPIVSEAVTDVEEMVSKASELVVKEKFAGPGELLVIVAGMPFGQSGTTNMIRIARLR